MMWLLYATGTREFSLSSSDDFSWWLDVGIGAVSPVKQSSDRRRQARPVRLGAIDDRVRAAEWPDTMRLRQVLASYTAFLAGVGFSHTFNAALVRARPKRSTPASASLCRRARASFRSSGGTAEWGWGIEPRANHPLYSSSSSFAMFLSRLPTFYALLRCCTPHRPADLSSYFRSLPMYQPCKDH